MSQNNCYLLQKQEEYCVRCRSRPGVFSCSICDGLNFCDQCDYYVHSVNSKKTHKRTHISMLPDKYEAKEVISHSGQNFFQKSHNKESFEVNNKSLVLNNTNSFNPDQNVASHSRMSTMPTTLYDITNKSINRFSLNSLERNPRSTSNEKLYERKENGSTGPYSKEYIAEMKVTIMYNT